MNVFAYCCASFEDLTRQTAGVEPLLSPPVSAGNFEPAWLEGCDFIYLDLHGKPGAEYWLGDDGIIALLAGQVREADLSGAVVFATNCYLADEDSPMMEALLAAGARYVIGGEGQNWALERRPSGAAMLGMRFRESLEDGNDPLLALALAKKELRLAMMIRKAFGRKTMAVKDTLAFRAYYRKEAV